MFNLSRKNEVFADFVNLALGVFLFLSPWIFGFTSDLGWHTSWIAGTAISIIAISSIWDLVAFLPTFDFFETEEWLILAIGLWLAACPWPLGFHSDTMATEVHFSVGMLVSTIAAVELWVLRHKPPLEGP